MTHIGTVLYEMAEREFSEFLEKLKILSPDEIIRNSYEKTIKEDILLVLEDISDDFTDVELLINTGHPLDYLYNEWLSNDYSYLGFLEDTITNAISNIKKSNQSI